MAFEQLIDETTGLDFVEHSDAFAEPLHRKFIDLLPVELVFFDDGQDQVTLLVRSCP